MSEMAGLVLCVNSKVCQKIWESLLLFGDSHQSHLCSWVPINAGKK